MDLGTQLLQPLLVGDAEVLFLVDDQKPEVAEFHRLGEKRMGADDDVDTTVADAFHGRADLFR